MIFKSGTHKTTPRVPMDNGQPGGTIQWLVEEDLLEQCGRCFTIVTVLPGAEIPSHQHVGELEVFYVIAGSGMYYDNGIPVRVAAGDCMFCKENEYHGLKNDGAENVVLAALCGYPHGKPKQ